MTALLTLISGAAAAQYKSELTEKLKRDEVPAAVQLSLKNALTAPPADGRWQLLYIETTIENSHDVNLTPEFYRYSFMENGNLAEFFYTPQGILDHTKGIEERKISHSQQEQVK